MLCLQEDLRTQLRKMEAGTSDKDEVEAPNGMVETCSIFMYFLLQRPVREEETHRSIPLQDLRRAIHGFVWNYQDVFTFSCSAFRLVQRC